MRFNRSITNSTMSPDARSTTISQGLFGEQVEVLHAERDVYRIRHCRDNYEGYVPSDSLIDINVSATHFVSTRATLLFAEPDIKSPVEVRACFGSEMTLTELGEQWSRTDQGYYVFSSHYLPMGQPLDLDLAAVAETLFLGVPYQWGGRSPDGYDCTGLVQSAAFGIGKFLPRDSAQQESFIKNDVSKDRWQRSDLVFWPGHVAVLLDPETLLHATAHSMLSLVEPVAAVVARAGAVSSVRRL